MITATDAEARAVIDQCQEHGCRLLIHNNLEERYTHPLVPIAEDGRHFYTLQEEPLEDPLNGVSSAPTISRSPALRFCWCCLGSARGWRSCSDARRPGRGFMCGNDGEFAAARFAC